MPPKPKFSQEEVAAAALAIIREEGVDALTARNLGSRLGTSSRPIFTVFRNMDEVKWAAREIAMREFESYTGDYVQYTPAFKRMGMEMISYAVHEPEMFKLLFMQEWSGEHRIKDPMQGLGNIADDCIALVQQQYQMSRQDARMLFEHMWMYTFGIGALCCMKVCDFTEEEISRRLTEVFAGLLLEIRAGRNVLPVLKPKENGSGSEPLPENGLFAKGDTAG